MSGQSTVSFLRAHGLDPRPGMGQHFLVDESLLEEIAASAAIDSERDLVLEVGPGPGTLTRHLVRRGAPVVAVELDGRFREPVLERLGRPANLCWVDGDVLESKHAIAPCVVRLLRSEGVRAGRKLVLVSNLPYQIAVPVLVNLLEADVALRGAAITVQRELAGRLVAEPGTRAYGPVSVFVRAAGQGRVLRTLKPGCFRPPPKVASAVVSLTFDPDWRRHFEPYDRFREVVSGLFRYRRKTLAAALRASFPGSGAGRRAGEVIARLGARRRPETLETREFLELARGLEPGDGPGRD